MVFFATIPNELPGLVLYLVFHIDNIPTAALLTALALAIQTALRAGARDAGEKIDEIAQDVAYALEALAVGLAIVLVLQEIVAAVVIADGLGAALAALQAVGARLALALSMLMAGPNSATSVPVSNPSSQVSGSADQTTELIARLAMGAFGPLPDGSSPRATLMVDRLLIDFPEPLGQSEEDIGRTDIVIGNLVELKRMPIGRWAAFSSLWGICATFGLAALVQGVNDFPPPQTPPTPPFPNA